MKLFAHAIFGLTLLSGCATSDQANGEPEQPASGICDASAVQSYVGEMANEETGTKILAESGARTLRWGAPDSAWTMDYREDRVNVRHDADMVILTIGCG